MSRISVFSKEELKRVISGQLNGWISKYNLYQPLSGKADLLRQISAEDAQLLHKLAGSDSYFIKILNDFVKYLNNRASIKSKMNEKDNCAASSGFDLNFIGKRFKEGDFQDLTDICSSCSKSGNCEVQMSLDHLVQTVNKHLTVEKEEVNQETLNQIDEFLEKNNELLKILKGF